MRFGLITTALISCFALPALGADDVIYLAADLGEIKSRPADDAYLSSQVVVIIPAETGPFKFKAYNPWADPLPFDYGLPFEQIKSQDTLFVPLDGPEAL